MSAVKSTLQCYAEAVAHERLTHERAQAATDAHIVARNGRQALWRIIKMELNEGTLKPGIHAVGSGSAVLVGYGHDYPDVLPLLKSYEG